MKQYLSAQGISIFFFFRVKYSVYLTSAISNLCTQIGYFQPQSLKIDDAIWLVNQANVELWSKLNNLRSCLQIPVFCPKSSQHTHKCLGKETSAGKTTRAALLNANSLLP